MGLEPAEKIKEEKQEEKIPISSLNFNDKLDLIIINQFKIMRHLGIEWV